MRGGKTVDIRSLYEQTEALWHDMRSILDAAEAEGRDVTPEEMQRYRELEKEIDRVIEQRKALASAELADMEERMKREAIPVVAERGQDSEQRAFARFLRAGLDGLDETERRALGTLTGPSGGFLVPQTMARDIVTVVTQYSAMRQVVQPIVTQSGEPILIPVVNDTANIGTRVAENATAPNLDPVFGQKQLSVYKYAGGVIAISLELLRDSAYPLEQRLFQLLGERIGRAIEQDYITGTGTNQPEGILNAPVGKTTAANNAISYDELVDFVHSLDPAYRANAVWILHDSTVQAIRKLKSTTGDPLWQPSMADAAPGTILGYRYYTSPYVPPIGPGAKVAVFGDLKAAYLIRDVQGIEMVRSDRAMVDTYQVQFNAWLRTGGVIQNTAAVRVLQMAL